LQLQPFMAERAHSRHTVAVEGASHAVMASHPEAVVELIVEAASSFQRSTLSQSSFHPLEMTGEGQVLRLPAVARV
jgi:hypothetical protein